MTSDYRRVVVGYPNYVYLFGVGDLAPADPPVVLNLSPGPGEVLGFAILHYAGTAADIKLMKLKIELDGVTKFNDYMCFLFAHATNKSAQGMFATSHYQAATLSTHSFLFRMPYATSGRFTFTNTGAASISCAWGIYYRRGA